MDKRTHKRISTNIEINYYLWNPLVWKKLYRGTIKNLSKNGMLISTKTRDFPRDSLLEIYIPFKKDVMYIPARASNIVWRRVLSDNSCDAIGIELSDPPQEYVDLVDSIS
jgi:hypothetical protein